MGCIKIIEILQSLPSLYCANQRILLPGRDGLKQLKLIIPCAALVALLSGCGGGGGSSTDTNTNTPPASAVQFPALGPLTIPKKTVNDPPFDVTPPTSTSPGQFTYTSNNSGVATISGKTVTIQGKGIAVITAQQAPSGNYTGQATSTTIVVVDRLDGFVNFGGLLWMPVTFTRNWADANTYCTTSTIDGQTGWRLPTLAELEALTQANAADGNDWIYMATWTSDGNGLGGRYTVSIGNKLRSFLSETDVVAVTCVK